MDKLIFVVDDEAHIRELIEYNLKQAGYMVRCFENGQILIDALKNSKPDLIILDIMMPIMQGTQVCQILKNQPTTKDIPIIFVTAKSSEYDKIIGLEGGADDYITKPFSVNELIARVRTIMRRYSKEAGEEKQNIIEGNIVIYIDRYVAEKNGIMLPLTKKEFELLKTLMQSKNRVFTRDELLDRIWGYNYYGDTRTVDVHIRQLRKYLGDDGEKSIQTVRGVGYKFVG